MDKSNTNNLSMKCRLALCLFLYSLAVHQFVDFSGHFNSPSSFQPFAEHKGELDHSEYEHEDDFVPFGLLSATVANTLGSKTIAANSLAFSRSNRPLLPPPIAA